MQVVLILQAEVFVSEEQVQTHRPANCENETHYAENAIDGFVSIFWWVMEAKKLKKAYPNDCEKFVFEHEIPIVDRPFYHTGYKHTDLLQFRSILLIYNFCVFSWLFLFDFIFDHFVE